jgi:hypothetical protein
MSETNNIWKSINSILVVAQFEKIESVIQWREALKNTGLNVHNCRILSIIGNKKDRMALGDMSYVTFVSEGDFNFLGLLKNEDAKKLLSDKFDAVLIINECSPKILKLVNKVKCRIDIGLNTGAQNRMVNLTSEETEQTYLLNFVKQTLERIS